MQVSRLERLVVLRLDANSLSSLPDELEALLDLTGTLTSPPFWFHFSVAIKGPSTDCASSSIRPQYQPQSPV